MHVRPHVLSSKCKALTPGAHQHSLASVGTQGEVSIAWAAFNRQQGRPKRMQTKQQTACTDLLHRGSKRVPQIGAVTKQSSKAGEGGRK